MTAPVLLVRWPRPSLTWTALCCLSTRSALASFFSVLFEMLTFLENWTLSRCAADGAPVPGKPFAGRDFHHIWKVLGAALRALGDLDVSEPAGPHAWRSAPWSFPHPRGRRSHRSDPLQAIKKCWGLCRIDDPTPCFGGDRLDGTHLEVW